MEEVRSGQKLLNTVGTKKIDKVKKTM